MCEKKDSMIVLACHGVYDPDLRTMYAEHTEDLEIFQADLEFALHCLRWRKNENPTLVISGGQTKIQRQCSEGRSYIQMARDLNLTVPPGVLLEDYALTSIENLLLSLYSFHIAHGHYPKKIYVISWEFKEERFKKTFAAINEWIDLECKWNPESDFTFLPVSNLTESELKHVEHAEKAYIQALENGLDKYYQDQKTRDLIKNRDPFETRKLAIERYKNYKLPEGFSGETTP